MATVSILPLRLYRVAVEPVSELEREFYLVIAKLLFPGNTSDPILPLHTIPIDHRACTRSEEVSAAISRRYARIDQGVECLVVDLTNPPYRLLPDHHVIGGLLAYLNAYNGDEFAGFSVVVLMPVILADTDMTMRALKPYLCSGRIGLISDDGSVSGAWAPLGNFDGDAYAAALKAIRRSPTWLLRKKMIRRPGHFKRKRRNGSHDHCLPYFFDGRFCQKELFDLISHHVSVARTGGRLPTVLYHCPESKWLYDAVISVCQLHDLSALDADALLDRSRERIAVLDTSLLVVPLVDTMGTLRELLSAMLADNPACHVDILAIISTQRQSDIRENSTFEIRGHQFPITYLMHADRPRLDPECCPACRVKMAEHSPGQPDRYLQLTAHAMWSMFLDSGVKDEQDVPVTRESIGPVPDLLKLVVENSPYLSLKIDTLLRSCSGGLPVNPVIIYPDQDGARAIADSLSSLYDYTFIAIPRQILDALQNEKDASDECLTALDPSGLGKDSRWFVELSSLRGGNDIQVILLDEFNRSGETRRRLERLARNFHLQVWCYFCLIDFSPSSHQHAGIPCLSLYDLELEFAD